VQGNWPRKRRLRSSALIVAETSRQHELRDSVNSEPLGNTGDTLPVLGGGFPNGWAADIRQADRGSFAVRPAHASPNIRSSPRSISYPALRWRINGGAVFPRLATGGRYRKSSPRIALG
jgi:hypothetical protein